MRRQILTAKSGISNHAAAGIRDDPCLSKFGTLRECPNVAKTRHGMPATAWKKYVNFASKNFPPSVYSGTFLFAGLLIILLIKAKHDMLIATILSSICLVLKRDNGSIVGVVDVLLDLIRL